MGSRSGRYWCLHTEPRGIRGEGAPAALSLFLDKWIERIREDRRIPQWPEKYAGFLFEYQGIPYKVMAADFETDDSKLAIFAREIANELVNGLGAEKVFYSGMLD